jgi:hypothetical protein
MPDVTTISYHGMEPCAIGSIVEVLVSKHAKFKVRLKFGVKYHWNFSINV